MVNHGYGISQPQCEVKQTVVSLWRNPELCRHSWFHGGSEFPWRATERPSHIHLPLLGLLDHGSPWPFFYLREAFPPTGMGTATYVNYVCRSKNGARREPLDGRARPKLSCLWAVCDMDSRCHNAKCTYVSRFAVVDPRRGPKVYNR